MKYWLIIILSILFIKSSPAISKSNFHDDILTSKSDTTLANEHFERAIVLAENAKYDSSNYFFKKAEDIYKEGGRWEDYIKCLNNIGKNYQTERKYDQAMNYYKKALEDGLKKIGNNPIIAQSYKIIGDVYLLKKKFVKALEYYKRELKLKIELLGKGHTKVADVYFNIGVAYDKNGEYDLALEELYKSLNIRKRNLGENHQKVAKSYHAIGGSLGRNGENKLALEYLNKGLKMRISLLGEHNQEVAKTYNLIGIIFKNMNDFVKSEQNYLKSLNIMLDINGPEHPTVASSYNNLAIIYRYKGNYEAAENFYKRAISILQKKYDDNKINLAMIYTNLGYIYYEKRDFDKAVTNFNKSLSILENLLNPNHPIFAGIYNNLGLCYGGMKEYDKAYYFYQSSFSIIRKTLGENNPEIASKYVNFGVLLTYKGEYEKGLENLNTALKIFRKNFDEDNYYIAKVFHAIGTVYEKLNRKEKAMEFYNRSLNIFIKIFGDKSDDICDNYISIGRVFEKKKDYKKSLTHYQKALIAISKDFENDNFSYNPNLNNIIDENSFLNVLKLKAKVLYDLFLSDFDNLSYLEISIKTFEHASKLINQMRKSYKYEGSKLFLNENVSEVYHEAIQAALKLYEITKEEKYKELAFKFSEENKAGLLNESLSESYAKKYASIPDTLLEREKDLRLDLTFYDNFLQEERLKKEGQDSLKISRYEDKLFSLKRKYESLLEDLESSYPDYYNLKYDTEVVDVKTIQSRLKENEVMIEYSLSDTTLVTFVIAPNEFEAYNEKIDSLFHKELDVIHESLGNVYYMNESLDNYQKSVDALYVVYNKLIKPAEDKIGGKNLIIIPDGKLGYIPFETLLTEEVKSEEIAYNNLPYLLKKNQICYGYSATIHINTLEKEEGIANENLLAFAPSFKKLENNLDDRLLRELLIRGEISELIGAKRETSFIHQLMGGDLYTDSSATEKMFKEKAGNYKILHIATHGVINDQNPMLSKLIFSRSQEDTIEDGFLNTSELFNMELNAELAVLSACNTGYGKLYKGEGVVSLARGFLYAGVPSLVTSLWKVNDEKTAEIMQSFYKYLKEGMSKDAALRKAKLDYIEGSDEIKSNPYYWAAFVNIGNTRPIDFNRFNYWWAVLGLVVLLTILIYFRRSQLKK